MNAIQAKKIVELTRKLRIGTRVDQGIKRVIGKMPINMSASRADAVIDALTDEWNASDAKADADQAMFHFLNDYADV